MFFFSYYFTAPGAGAGAVRSEVNEASGIVAHLIVRGIAIILKQPRRGLWLGCWSLLYVVDVGMVWVRRGRLLFVPTYIHDISDLIRVCLEDFLQGVHVCKVWPFLCLQQHQCSSRAKK